MLVLSRKVGEKLVIGDNVTIVVNQVAGRRVSIGIEAPDEVRITRGELGKIRDEFAGDGASGDEAICFRLPGEPEAADASPRTPR